MPWQPSDAHAKTHSADTAKKKRMWAHIANAILAKGGGEASAIKQANAAVKRAK